MMTTLDFCKPRLPTTRPWLLLLCRLALVGMAVCGAASDAADGPRTLHVGPGQEFRSIGEAAKHVQNGDTILVEAGDYPGDVVVWANKRVTLRAAGGRVRIDAAGASVEGKGIWVVRGGELSVDGFDFMNASVPDRNGAGIRLDSGALVVKHCRFLHNENGILAGNDKTATLEIENSEFGYNGFGDGQSHNLYVGGIARLKVSGSYFHHAKVGHLLKSRAAESIVLYNRLTDESGGHASYELEFPNGGMAIVVGNLIEQSATTENPHLIAYGTEGKRWERNTLTLVNNTLVDDRRSEGVFIRWNRELGKLVAANNLLVGPGKIDGQLDTAQGNVPAGKNEFVRPENFDYRLRPESKLRGAARRNPPATDEVPPIDRQYAHPAATRAVSPRAPSPGAFQD